MDQSTTDELERLYDRAVEMCKKHHYVISGKPMLKFLYSSAGFLPTTTGLLILGANPGGGELEHKAEDPRRPFNDPDYCAYLDEKWWDGAKNRLPRGQHRIQRRIRRIAEALLAPEDEKTVDQLVRLSPAGNILPFRSPKWEDLPASLRGLGTCAVCRTSHFDICTRIVEIAKPALIVTIGGSATARAKALGPLGTIREHKDAAVPIWDKWWYREYEIITEGQPIVVAALPAVNSQRMDEPRFIKCLEAISSRRSAFPPLTVDA